MDEITIESKFKEIFYRNTDFEDFLSSTEGAVVFANGKIHFFEALEYGKTELTWHAGDIKQVNITQNIRM